MLLHVYRLFSFEPTTETQLSKKVETLIDQRLQGNYFYFNLTVKGEGIQQ